MRSTITLNGKSSEEISGLLIQSLPPISKPLMRTQIEEIDGRDGDITTKLGYSAYDKEITIGLYGDFDINEVIAYFNSEGIVTFSNEPDKYYYYEILDQIDFERLIRFRTATVTMHCQPFKYSTTENGIVLEPEGVDNLLTIPDFTKTTNGITLTVDDGVVSVVGTGTAATEFYVPTGGLNLAAGSYTLIATASGRGATATSIRLIKSAPSNADSFGGKYITLKNAPVTLSATLTAATTYNYLWFYINAGTELNFTLDTKLENEAQKAVSGEGTDIVLQGSALAPFSQFDLKGDTDQTTYSGKNLFNLYRIHTVGYTQTSNGVTTTFLENGGVRIQGTAARQADINVFGAGYWGVSGNIASIFGSDWSGKTFTTSGTASTSDSSKYNFHVWFFKNGSSAKVYNNNQTWTAPTSDQADGVYIYITVESGKTIDVTWYPQIEKSSTATDFEPYVGGTASPNPDYPQDVQVVTGEQTITITDGDSQSQEYTIDLDTLELCKMGNYQDYIYKSNDKWYKHKAIDKVIDDGTKTYWTRSNTSTTHSKFYTSTNDVLNYPIADALAIVCDRFVANIGANDAAYSDSAICGNATAGDSYTKRLWYSVPISIATTASAFQTWLAANPVTVYYAMTTPIEEEITDSTLIAQLDEIDQHAHAYKGQTHISSTCATENLPHIIAAEVVKNNEGTVTNEGNIYSKPKLTIYGEGDVGIYLNGVQMFQIALGSLGSITIDTAAMEAYTDTTSNLQNRAVTGDYDNFQLPVGESSITFSGTVTMCIIENYSRWL